jgi:hypothetical protein
MRTARSLRLISCCSVVALLACGGEDGRNANPDGAADAAVDQSIDVPNPPDGGGPDGTFPPPDAPLDAPFDVKPDRSWKEAGSDSLPDAVEAGPPRDAHEAAVTDVAPPPPDVHFVFDTNPANEVVCASSTGIGSLTPLDMFIMLDRSGSMLGTKWDNARAVLKSYFVSAGARGPKSNPNRAALQVFPYYDGSINDDCAGDKTGTAISPPGPTLAILPGNDTDPVALAFRQAIDSLSTGSNTPTESAVRGISRYTQANKTSGREMIGILITDGDPLSTCDDSTGPTGKIATVLKALAAPPNNIRTFVIGLDGIDDWSKLEAMATYGGGPSHAHLAGLSPCGGGMTSCHHYNVGSGSASTFQAVLQRIQQIAAPCDYPIPTPEGGTPDFTRTRMIFSTEGQDVEFQRVASESACSTSDQSYYYDNASAPTKISLCPATCGRVQTATETSLTIRVSCLSN